MSCYLPEFIISPCLSRLVWLSSGHAMKADQQWQHIRETRNFPCYFYILRVRSSAIYEYKHVKFPSFVWIFSGGRWWRWTWSACQPRLEPHNDMIITSFASRWRLRPAARKPNVQCSSKISDYISCVVSWINAYNCRATKCPQTQNGDILRFGDIMGQLAAAKCSQTSH